MSVVRKLHPEEPPVPYSQEAEEAVIGACLLSSAAMDKATAVLKPEDFHSPNAAEVFRAMQAIQLRGEPVDLVTVSHELFARGTLGGIGRGGGVVYLADALHNVPTPGSCVHYAKIVASNAVLRGIHDAGERITALAASPKDLDEVCADVESIAIEATERRGSAGPKSPDDFIPEYLARIEASSSRPVPGAPTGLRDFDLLLGGLKPAALITLAADSGLGKSSLAVAASLEAAIVGHSVLFFSLEMPADELTERMVAYLAAVPLEGLQRGTLDMEQDRRASDALGTLHQLPLRIEDSPPYTTLEIAASCRRQKASPLGLGLVVVDHLGLVTSTIRGDNRPQQVSEITRSLKLLSRQQHVPVLALCQYRKTGRPSDARPTWDDLKDSSSIRHDSDVVTFIWQPDAGLDDHRVLIVAKHRSGRTADVHCHWNGSQVRFENASFHGGTRPSEEGRL
jgi:replicative DNA helicase